MKKKKNIKIIFKNTKNKLYNSLKKDFLSSYSFCRKQKICIKVNIIHSKKLFHQLKLYKREKIEAFCIKKNIYILDFDVLNYSEEDYYLLLKHEFIHAVIFSLYGEVDNWINEGVAYYLSGQLKNEIVTLKNFSLINFDDLRTSFLHTRECYISSAIYVKYLYENYFDVLISILKGKCYNYNILNESTKYIKKLFAQYKILCYNNIN